MQIRATMRHYHTLVRLANAKTYVEIACLNDIVRNPFTLLVQIKKDTRPMEYSTEFFKKLKVELSYDSYLYMHIHKYVLIHTVMDIDTKEFE